MEREFDAYCGLYCGACYIMIANLQGTVPALAQELGVTPEELACLGCKTEVQPEWCAKCGIRACASGKAVQHCGECPDFPCLQIETASRRKPHLCEIQDNCREMKRDGVQAWLAHQKQLWACPDCGTPFSWYAKDCPACGAPLSASWRKGERR